MATSFRGSIVALIFAILMSILFPTVGGQPVTYVAGALVMLFYNGSVASCLWAALATGLVMDAIDLTPRFGFLGLAYLLSSWMLYPMRLYFFKDSTITLPVMTFFFSLLAGCAEFFIALFFDIGVPKTYWEHLFALPLLDALATLVIFMLPSFLWHLYRVKIQRRRYSDDT